MKVKDIPEEKMLRDGIYDVTDIPFVHVGDNLYDIKEFSAEVVAFINAHPDYVVGSAYQCPDTFFLGSVPAKANIKHHGQGFNYGSTNLLEDCPRSLLILAEDD